MISAHGGLPAHRYTLQVTPRWPRGSEPASLFTGVPARCVVLRVRWPEPFVSLSPVCSLGVLCWVCCVLGDLAPVPRCAGPMCCVACAVSPVT